MIPRISLISHISFNRIASEFSRHGTFVSANFRFTFQNTLSENFAIGYNLGMEWDDFREPPVYIYTLTGGLDIGERWYSYIELFGSHLKDYYDQHSFDIGLAYYINDNVKADVSAGIGLNKYAPDNYVGVGISWRFKASKR